MGCLRVVDAPAFVTSAGTLRSPVVSTDAWFSTARNYVMYANEGGLYDDVKPWLTYPSPVPAR